jgi:hypothetical protein
MEIGEILIFISLGVGLLVAILLLIDIYFFKKGGERKGKGNFIEIL